MGAHVCARTGRGMPHVMRHKGRLLRGYIKRNGERVQSVVVSLRRDNETVITRVHRLVLEAFVGPCPHWMEGCHNDGNPLNNAVTNLRWDTPKANQADSQRHGTKCHPPIYLGERHHNASISDADVRAIRSIEITRGTKAQLARQYGVTATTIGRILRRETRPLQEAWI